MGFIVFIGVMNALVVITAIALVCQCYWVRVSPSAPSWLIFLLCPSRTYKVLISLLFSIVIVLNDGWTIESSTLICLLLLLMVHYIAIGAFPQGARITWRAQDKTLSWWVDMYGRLHPHLESGKGSIVSLRPERATVELLADKIQLAGQKMGRPIKVQTPFKLGYLARRLSKQGWFIEEYPSTPVYPAMRAILCFRRRKSGRTWQRRWQDCALVHHAVFYPPNLTL